MFTVRCTARLLDRLKATPEAAPPSPTSKLGDWYANLIHVGGVQIVLAVSERTLLPVIVPAAPASSLVTRLVVEVGEMLRTLGVPEHEVAPELAEMTDVRIAKTASRQITGMLVEFAMLLDLKREEVLWRDEALFLARTPCSPLYRTHISPDRATRALWGLPPTKVQP